MTTVRHSAAGSGLSVVIGLMMAVVASTGVSAHRSDEYLQAARLGVDPSRVELELDLTAGIAVAEGILAAIDQDRDGSLSPEEQQAYAARVLSAIQLEVDGRPLQVQPLASSFPDIDAVRRGEGIIRLQLEAILPPLSVGAHQLFFRNAHRHDVSVYLANALVPESDRIAVTAQHRDADQCELTIEYVIRPWPAPSTRMWLLGGLVGVVAVATRLTRRYARYEDHYAHADSNSHDYKPGRARGRRCRSSRSKRHDAAGDVE